MQPYLYCARTGTSARDKLARASVGSVRAHATTRGGGASLGDKALEVGGIIGTVAY